MKNRTQIVNVIFEVLKFIFTLGISHINKRKDRLDNNDNARA